LIKRKAEEEVTSKILGEVLDANGKYAAGFGNKGDLALPPARRFAILTCMDARLDPAKYAGLSEGDAHVIRNAGGRASDDAIRSLVISHKLLGTLEWFVIHHTNCGMELFSDEIMGDLLEGSLATASFDGKTWSNPQNVATFTSPGGGKVVEPEPSGGCSAGHFIKWLTIKTQEESVAQDVRRIRQHPLVPPYVPIYGYIYDVKTGKLVEVPEATAAGRAA
jgi:carbonic anhydrase